jgi:hypothetical protein
MTLPNKPDLYRSHVINVLAEHLSAISFFGAFDIVSSKGHQPIHPLVFAKSIVDKMNDEHVLVFVAMLATQDQYVATRTIAEDSGVRVGVVECVKNKLKKME